VAAQSSPNPTPLCQLCLSTDQKERAGLPNKVELAIGMGVMVTFNMKMDLDVANRLQGMIIGIKLEEGEDIV